MLLVAALVHGWPRLVPLALAAVGAVYGAELAIDDAPLDLAAPAVAVGLYLGAELAYWSLEERTRVEAEPGETLRRIAIVAGLGLVALAVAAVPLVLVDAVRSRGLAIDLVGAAGAAAVLLAVVLFARRRPV